MDITQLDTLTANEEEAAVIPIYLKNGDPLTAKDGTQCTISVLGSDSARYKKEEYAITRSQLRSRKPMLDPEDIKKNRVRAAASVITTWSGFELDGTSAACTPANIARVLAHSWILSQVEAGISAHADFFGRSSSSSLSSSVGTPSSGA